MSVSGVSIGPCRQLSLQQPAPRRKPLRRQRSAEDDRSFPMYTNSIARGKPSSSKTRRFFEKPKVRVAWTENRCRNERSLESVDRVEVVARHMPGRSRPTTGRSTRGSEKPSILYSREELAERLRLAWKHREENKANIDIFLGHTLREERCESQASQVTVTVPSTPERSASGLPGDRKSSGYVKNEKRKLKRDQAESGEPMEEQLSEESGRLDPQDVTKILSRVQEVEKYLDGARTEMENSESTSKQKIEEEQERNTRANLQNSGISPSVKDTATANSPKIPKDDFSLARKKRASFQSGTNKAFLRHLKTPTDDVGIVSSGETKATTQKLQPNLRSVEKSAISRLSTRDRENSKENSKGQEEEAPKPGPEVRCGPVNDNSALQRRSGGRAFLERRDGFTLERRTSSRNTVHGTGNEASEAMQIDRQPPRTPEAKSSEKICTGSRRDGSRIEQRTRRTNSAPPHRCFGNNAGNRVQVNIVIDTPNFGSTEKQEPTLDTEGKGNTEKLADSSPKLSNRPIRSAPLKRRARSAKKRSLGVSSSGRTDEDGKPRAKNCLDPRGIDVVTMVSLVSSADSDTEPENSPLDDKLIDQLRSKLPTTSIIKPSIGSALANSRKPIKSVSFQQDSFDEEPAKPQQQSQPQQQKQQQQQQMPQLPGSTRDDRKFNARYTTVSTRAGNSSSEEQIVWRTDIPGLALPVLQASIHDVEEPVELPLTDREKRCLAVPIGDLTGDNRKLVRTRSAPSRGEIERRSTMDTKEQTSTIVCLANESSTSLQSRTVQDTVQRKVDPTLTPRKDPAEQETKIVVAEPRFRTSKEKECWHLYKKMCDKGVYVSFDTVLRGMLTPTEYRLRQKELLQDF